MPVRWLDYVEVRYYGATENRGDRLAVLKDGKRLKTVPRDFSKPAVEQAVELVKSVGFEPTGEVLDSPKGYLIIIK